MKILLISNMYPEGESHFGIFVKEQANAIEKEGIEVLRVVRTRRTSFAYLIFILKCLFYLLFTSYDLIHAHYGFHSALIPAFIKKKPLIITYHGSDALQEPFRNMLYFFLQKFALRRCDHIIAVSNDVKNTLVNRLRACPDKISVISCGVDGSKFRPMDKKDARAKTGIDAGAKVVLFVGNVSLMKGADVLYECARHIPNALFILIGDVSFRREIKNCQITGPRPHYEMPLWMNASNLLLLPSRSEGTPNVILEALSCGIPVIASRVGGCPDLINDGKNGFLVEIGNPPRSSGKKLKGNEQFAYSEPIENIRAVQDRISYLLESDSKRDEMGEEGRKEVLKEYDGLIIARKIIGLYSRFCCFELNH